MSVRDLIPWGRSNGNQVPSVFRDGERDPFLSLHREVNACSTTFSAASTAACLLLAVFQAQA
jgi:hypothetical protein